MRFTHRQDADATNAATGAGSTVAESGAEVSVLRGAYLPHWTRAGGVYAVTFRLADSLPQSVLEGWLLERRDIVRRAARRRRELSEFELERLRVLHSERVEAYLDAGHGACWLRDARVARIASDALRHFEGKRYRLHAWCIMPNHVHAGTEPLPLEEISRIMHSWKSFTATAANRLLGRSGEFWQREYYDHLIRDEGEYAHAVEYVINNPVAAKLADWPWVWAREMGAGSEGEARELGR